MCMYVCMYTRVHAHIYKSRCELHKHPINLSLKSYHISCSSRRPVLLSHTSFLTCLFEFSNVCQGCRRGQAISQKHSQKITADALHTIHAGIQQGVWSKCEASCVLSCVRLGQCRAAQRPQPLPWAGPAAGLKVLNHGCDVAVPYAPPVVWYSLDPFRWNAYMEKIWGNGHKLLLEIFQLDTRAKFFQMRAISICHWNSLPRKVVDSSKLDIFKIRLDRVLGHLI